MTNTLNKFFVFTGSLMLPTMALAESSTESSILSIAPLILLFVVFYFILIRPQQKKAKAHKEMIGKLSKGDELLTYGGVLGRVVETDENFVLIEVAENVHLKVQRAGVSSLMPKGTYRSTFGSES